MMRRKPTPLLSVLAVLCFSCLAHAQGIRVFVEGSGSYLQNEQFFTTIFGDRFRSNYVTGGKVTGGGEFSLGKILGVEGAYGYGRNNLRTTNLSASETFNYGIRTQRVSGNLVVHSPISFLRVRPYATSGLEYDHFGPTSQAKTLAFTQGFADQLVALGASNQVGFNYGGGVEWDLLPALALRLDFRDHFTGTPTYGLSSSQFPITGSAHDLEFSAGVTFHIGK